MWLEPCSPYWARLRKSRLCSLCCDWSKVNSTLLRKFLSAKNLSFSLNQFQNDWYFELLKDFHKFGIIGKPQPSIILQSKIFWKKEKLNLKKMKMKIFNLLCKIATYCKFCSQELQSFQIIKKIFPKIWERIKTTPCIKLVRIMLETWNLEVHTHM